MSTQKDCCQGRICGSCTALYQRASQSTVYTKADLQPPAPKTYPVLYFYECNTNIVDLDVVDEVTASARFLLDRLYGTVVPVYSTVLPCKATGKSNRPEDRKKDTVFYLIDFPEPVDEQLIMDHAFQVLERFPVEIDWFIRPLCDEEGECPNYVRLLYFAVAAAVEEVRTVGKTRPVRELFFAEEVEEDLKKAQPKGNSLCTVM
ncbi:hypothetical protein BJY04DRAFT_214801 [Aspergillus karnatakaensis]|uniref:uncharacterized protein n=1 Tax=Aspergillus karnatakaensis TaxID=1810916 RepID=UPI003CCCA7DA